MGFPSCGGVPEGRGGQGNDLNLMTLGNGDIAHFRVTGGGGHISGPSEEQLRQFEAEQAAKIERKTGYNFLIVDEILNNYRGRVGFRA